MRISFRYRFIISFVLLEVLFLVMIAIVNFSSLERNSNRLIEERIKSITSLGSELIMTPLSIYDVATLDNIIYGLLELEGIEHIELYDARGQKLSSTSQSVDENDNLIKIEEEIVFDTIKLGKLYIWLNLNTNYAELESNRHTTYLIILLEILASTLLSILIGFRLSKNLNILTDFVQKFAHESNTPIPNLKGHDEVTELANAMKLMQERINDRNEKLINLNQKLNNNIKILEEYESAVDKGSILSRGDLKGDIIYVNDALCKITGYSKDELIGQPHSILRHPNTPKKIFQKMWGTLHKGEIWHGILKNIRKNGTSFYVDITIIPIRNQENEVIEYLALRHDVSELVSKNKDLRRVFQTDLLTSLGNRYSLLENLKSLEMPYLAIFDIRGFKEINDSYSHQVGDQVIKKLGDRLFTFFNKAHYLAFRINIDEFAILGDGTLISQETFLHDVQKFQLDIESNIFKVMKHEFHLILTVGVAFEDKNNILSNASIVKQTAKQKNISFLCYSDDIKSNEGYQNNLFWTTKLITAVKDDQMVAYYQPIINNITGEIDKYETLVRIKEEDGTIISPNSFMDISKKARIYPKITKKMIDLCLESITKYNKDFSLNLSADDLANESTMTYLYNRLNQFSLGDKLTFEILENESLSSFDDLENFSSNIKKYGCKIAIDDFGTGYSNFDYIIRVKPHYLKIDGSIIRNVNEDENTYKVIEAIVKLAKINGIKTIAEFVMNESIYKTVCELGIDYSQGNFIGNAEALPSSRMIS